MLAWYAIPRACLRSPPCCSRCSARRARAVGSDSRRHSATEGTWLTVRGTPATYLPWIVGEPDGGTAQNCGRTSSTGFEARECIDLRDYVCECE